MCGFDFLLFQINVRRAFPSVEGISALFCERMEKIMFASIIDVLRRLINSGNYASSFFL